VIDRRLAVAGITFDFGNTLVRVDRRGLQAVVSATAAALRQRGVIDHEARFLAGWDLERDRQFRLQVPRGLEVDLAERVLHVLAGLRGARVPDTDDEPSDEEAAAGRVAATDVDFAVETYSEAFVATMPPLPGAEPVLRAAAAAGFRLGILSNWPLARTIDRYVAARGWVELFSAIVVSERVGAIKPHPAIFSVAAEAMRLPPAELLHVGDDWAADVVGARRAGWHVAYLRGHQGDTPLPTSTREPGDEPDLELDDLSELLAQVARAATSPTREKESSRARGQ
jgi:putative hydrolase of the HAD superfamily